MDPVREGGCQCGAIRYRFTGDPVTLVACHCSECQRQSGSAFGMSLVVRHESFELVAGTPRSFSRKADSGNRVECAFCESCGTRLYHRPEATPETLNIKPGTLDDTSWLQPAAHVWTRSQQPWMVIPEGVPQLETQPKPRSRS